MKPLVSIITPTYGRKHFLPLIYSCVQSQDWPNIEWLVDDDSPTPSSFMLGLADSRVRYAHSEIRRPVGTKRNELVERAKGIYIVHFDDDDYYAPNYISQMLLVMCNVKSDFVKLSGFFLYSRPYAQCAYWDLNLKTGLHFIWSAQAVETVELTSRNNHAFDNNHLGYGFSYVYHKRLWDQVKFPDVTWNEDSPFIITVNSISPVFCLSDTFGLCLHILNRNNSSKSFPQYMIPWFVVDRYFPNLESYRRALMLVQEGL